MAWKGRRLLLTEHKPRLGFQRASSTALSWCRRQFGSGLLQLWSAKTYCYTSVQNKVRLYGKCFCKLITTLRSLGSKSSQPLLQQVKSLGAQVPGSQSSAETSARPAPQRFTKLIGFLLCVIRGRVPKHNKNGCVSFRRKVMSPESPDHGGTTLIPRKEESRAQMKMA